jgi:formylglycine-generating enzyme required for sulfatase activity
LALPGAVLIGGAGIFLAIVQREPTGERPLSAEREKALTLKTSFRECAAGCPEMIAIPPGAFTMGAPVTEQGRFDNEGPQRLVTIAKRFAISKFDVTFADWDACVAAGGCPQTSDGGFGRGNKPVINVSWDDAQRYVAWLFTATGRPYRLPTEAEWEYTARSGTTTAYYWGDDVGSGNANCNGCGSAWDNRETAPVGSFKPNEFGFHDMAGDVWQWVEDCYHDDYTSAPMDGAAWRDEDCKGHVARGGAWIDSPQFLRSARRQRFPTAFRITNLGFRVARTLADP